MNTKEETTSKQPEEKGVKKSIRKQIKLSVGEKNAVTFVTKVAIAAISAAIGVTIIGKLQELVEDKIGTNDIEEE